MNWRTRWTGTIVLIAISFLRASPGAAADPGAGGSRPRLVLGWYDSFRLCAVMTPEIQREVLGTFDEMDVAAQWVEAPLRVMRRPGEVFVRVLVLRQKPTDWGLKRTTLGVVMKDGETDSDTAFIFAPRVFRVLGYKEGRRSGDCPEPAELKSVALAMARIVLHEVLHVIAPEHDHADEGLMFGNLDRTRLLKRDLRVDAKCLRAFREGLTRRAFPLL